MEDRQIVDMYWARNEAAIAETERKYGRMLFSLSHSLLSSREDAEECVNDTYLSAWRAMPTQRPAYLGPFLSKITRRISIDRWREAHRKKRGGTENLLSELEECLPDGSSVEKEYQNGILKEALDRFLHSLSEEKRAIFLRRYFFSQSVLEIAIALGIKESKVKVSLMRMRQELQKRLEKEELL